MKKVFALLASALVLASCGGVTDEEKATLDSTNVNMSNQSPMGDTANQINSRAGSYPSDTSNQNADDSVSGSSPATRSTTPGADSSGMQ